MKKLILSCFVAFTTISLFAQTMAFTCIEIKVKPFTQDNIAEAFDKVFEDVEMNQGGVVLERFWNGRTHGMTHRIVLRPGSFIRHARPVFPGRRRGVPRPGQPAGRRRAFPGCRESVGARLAAPRQPGWKAFLQHRRYPSGTS